VEPWYREREKLKIDQNRIQILFVIYWQFPKILTILVYYKKKEERD
jgi:hypothetical protein